MVVESEMENFAKVVTRFAYRQLLIMMINPAQLSFILISRQF